jgi:hypothetical protein
MPRAAPIGPPSPGDPDRKRVLNVLAQRRYRELTGISSQNFLLKIISGQRRKEKYAALEQQTKSGSSTSAESSSSPETSDLATRSSASGVLLSEPSNNGLYIDFAASDSDGCIDLSLNSLLDPQAFSNGVDFNNDFIPQIVQEPYDVYQAQPSNSLPMDTIMDVPFLKTLRVASMVAEALGSQHLMFNYDALWTVPSSSFPRLPANMQPTPAQLTIPHHPLFDILPWPQLRTKLICVFSLPEQLRPENARGSTALVQVAYDIEDEKDGFRVNGEGMEKDNWEVGQAFLKHWWWALDRSILETSNAWRQRRGESRLSMKDA